MARLLLLMLSAEAYNVFLGVTPVRMYDLIYVPLNVLVTAVVLLAARTGFGLSPSQIGLRWEKFEQNPARSIVGAAAVGLGVICASFLLPAVTTLPPVGGRPADVGQVLWKVLADIPFGTVLLGRRSFAV